MVLNTEWAQVEIIDLINDGTGLAFGIIGGRSTGVVVKTIIPGGVADRDGRLQSGDHILQIGEVNLRGLGSEQVASVLRQCGVHVRMVVARPVESTSTDYQALGSHAAIVPTKILGDQLELDRHLADNGYSESISNYSNRDSVPYIYTGQGDLQLRSISGLVDVVRNPLPIGTNVPIVPSPTLSTQYPNLSGSYYGGSREVVVDLLPLDMALRQPTNLPPETEVYAVTLHKDDLGLGITVAGYVCEKEEISGIFVKSISKGSAADMTNKIKINDRIIQVDSHSVVGLTNHQAVELLRNAGITVKLLLERYLRGPKFEQLQQAIKANELMIPSPPSPSLSSLPKIPFSLVKVSSLGIEPEADSRTSFDFDSAILLDTPFSNSDENEIIIETLGGRKSVQFSICSHESIHDKWKVVLLDDTELVIAEMNKDPQSGLGISLEGTVDVEDGLEVRPHHYIRNILPNGPVGKNNILQSGDELLEVNGIQLLGLNHVEVVSILKQLPSLVLLVCVRSSVTTGIIDTAQHRDAFQARNLLAGSITTLIPNSERMVKAKSDTSIVSSVASETCSLDSRSKSLEIITGLPMWSDQPTIVDLMKADHGLGFSILDYQDPLDPLGTVIVIRSLVPGGVASQDGRLLPGDRLLSVNGLAVDGGRCCTLDQAVQVLKAAPRGLVRIAVAKPITSQEGDGEGGGDAEENSKRSQDTDLDDQTCLEDFQECIEEYQECLDAVQLMCIEDEHSRLSQLDLNERNAQQQQQQPPPPPSQEMSSSKSQQNNTAPFINNRPCKIKHQQSGSETDLSYKSVNGTSTSSPKEQQLIQSSEVGTRSKSTIIPAQEASEKDGYETCLDESLSDDLLKELEEDLDQITPTNSIGNLADDLAKNDELHTGVSQVSTVGEIQKLGEEFAIVNIENTVEADKTRIQVDIERFAQELMDVQMELEQCELLSRKDEVFHSEKEVFITGDKITSDLEEINDETVVEENINLINLECSELLTTPLEEFGDKDNVLNNNDFVSSSEIVFIDNNNELLDIVNDVEDVKPESISVKVKQKLFLASMLNEVSDEPVELPEVVTSEIEDSKVDLIIDKNHLLIDVSSEVESTRTVDVLNIVPNYTKVEPEVILTTIKSDKYVDKFGEESQIECSEEFSTNNQQKLIADVIEVEVTTNPTIPSETVSQTKPEEKPEYNLTISSQDITTTTANNPPKNLLTITLSEPCLKPNDNNTFKTFPDFSSEEELLKSYDNQADSLGGDQFFLVQYPESHDEDADEDNNYHKAVGKCLSEPAGLPVKCPEDSSRSAVASNFTYKIKEYYNDIEECLESCRIVSGSEGQSLEKVEILGDEVIFCDVDSILMMGVKSRSAPDIRDNSFVTLTYDPGPDKVRRKSAFVEGYPYETESNDSLPMTVTKSLDINHLPDRRHDQLNVTVMLDKHWGPIRTVQIHREPNTSLGISIVGGKVDLCSTEKVAETVLGIFIKNVVPNSPAGRTGQLKTGDRILDVSGVDLRNVSHEKAVEVIRYAKNPISFTIQSIVPINEDDNINISLPSTTPNLTNSFSQETRSYEERKGRLATHKSVEFAAEPVIHDLERADEVPAAVAEVVEKKATVEESSEESDDSEDERELGGRTVSKQGQEIDRASAANVKRTKQEIDDDKQEEDDFGYTSNKVKKKYANLGHVVQMVQLERGGQGLGLSLAGHKDRNCMAVFVCGINPTGAAFRAGGIQVGDEILEVNGVVLHGRCHLNASAIIKGLSGPIFKVIILRRKAAIDDIAVRPITQFPTALAEEASEESFSHYPNVRTISIKKGSQSLGIMIIEGKHADVGQGIFISDIQEGSSAEKAGLEIGEMILAVNKDLLLGSNYDTAANLLKRTEGLVTLVVSNPGKRPTSPTTTGVAIDGATGDKNTANNKSGLKTTAGQPSRPTTPVPEPPADPSTCPIALGKETNIDITTDNKGLGLFFIGGKDTQIQGGIVVVEIFTAGGADKDGRLQPGDQILEVNGTSLKEVSHNTASQALRQTLPKMKLVVFRPEKLDYQSIDSDFVRKAGKGLGLSIMARKSGKGVYVAEILNGGSADVEGKIIKGDIIASVNGQSVENSAADEAGALLKTATGKVTLKLNRYKPITR